MERMRTTEGGDEKGYSLIEVVIALGVLSSVLISIASMFILGGRQVKTGKTITEATVIAHDIMEFYDQQSYTGVYTNFGALTTDSTKTINSTTVGSPLVPWQTTINSELNGGLATATILALGPGTPTFGSGVGIRLTVTITWSELGRPQTVSLTTTRL